MDLSGYTSWKDLADDIITILQILITLGCGIRCIVILQKGREEEVPLSKSLNQCKKFLYVVILSITIGEMVKVIGGYF